jgi:hypothetical protein
MANVNESYVLEYSILDSDQGVSLKIWEPAEGSSRTIKRVRPYLFSANYQLASREMALQVLNQFLTAAGAKAVPASQVTAKGHLTVVPHPTDEIWV